ncbi:E3 ubiquitin-protein ligase NEURL1 [Vulpes lagopus]
MGNNFSSIPSLPRGNPSRAPRGHPQTLKGSRSQREAELGCRATSSDLEFVINLAGQLTFRIGGQDKTRDHCSVF